MRASLLVLVGLLGCGHPMGHDDSGEPEVDAGIVDAGTSAELCTETTLLALESKMRTALQNTVTDHSFYIELRRPGVDGRAFAFSRDIDGALDENTTIRSASSAKMISAAVILDVVANPQLYPGHGMVNGKAFTLDSLARDFLPDGQGGTYWRTNTGALPTNNRLYGVTLRQLLSFSSGLELENAPGGPECIGAPSTAFTHGA